MKQDREPELRIATVDDISSLARHHRKMFQEIWEKKEIPIDKERMQRLGEVYAEQLFRELRDGTCRSWVISQDSRIISSGAVRIIFYVPVPHDPSPRIAFLHSIYTEREERGKGYASRITEEAVRFCSREGIHRMYLFASEAGRSVYEKRGFVPVDNLMIRMVGP